MGAAQVTSLSELLRKSYVRLCLLLLLLLPSLGVAFWTVAPSVKAVVAAYMITPVAMPGQPFDDLGWVDFRRQLQKHFSSYGLYIPMEDIIISDADLVGQELPQFMRAACGDGLLYVWIPLKMRLPVYGSVVWDWCWVPKVART